MLNWNRRDNVCVCFGYSTYKTSSSLVERDIFLSACLRIAGRMPLIGTEIALGMSELTLQPELGLFTYGNYTPGMVGFCRNGQSGSRQRWYLRPKAVILMVFSTHMLIQLGLLGGLTGGGSAISDPNPAAGGSPRQACFSRCADI